MEYIHQILRRSIPMVGDVKDIDVKDILGAEFFKDNLRQKIRKYRIMQFKDSKPVKVTERDIRSFRFLASLCLDIYERNGLPRIKFKPLIWKR